MRAMRRAGRAAAATLAKACAAVRPGITTGELDAIVAADTRRRGGTCAPFGVTAGGPPFPGHCCTSVNDVVCHGIPGPRVLEDGDIFNIDVTTKLKGWHGDTSRTILVGTVSPEAAHLVQVTQRCLDLGIAAVRPGAPISVIGEAIEPFARANGCTVVRALGGHGIGRSMHEPPHIPHHRCIQPIRMHVGMCFTIEPMICLGQPDVVTLDDEWTVVTADGSLSAQFEHTLRVTDDGAEVLTV